MGAVLADLQKAVFLHQRGQFDQAGILYRQVLAAQPEHADALHMLGVLEAQGGNPQKAVDLIQRAIAVTPDNPLAHNNCGNALQDLGRSAEALASYDRALALKPDYAQALDSRGNVLRALGRFDEAVASYDRVLTLVGNDPSVLNNRGAALSSLRRYEEAIASYDQALSTAPDYAEASYNRGNALRGLERYDDALASYDRALSLDPSYVDALHNRGLTLRDLHRPEEALASYDRAVMLKPEDANLHIGRGHALSELKRTEEAIASYREALAQGGDKNLLDYYLAALGAGSSPSASPRAYVEGLFDQYATRFDQALTELEYRIPEQLFGTVTAIRADGGRDIADLGCGTGMCGILFRSIAQSLVGVDISQNMLEKARERGVYDHLLRADLLDFLGDHPQSFDLIVTADVLVYIGALDAVFAAAARSLRPRGQLAYSVESEEGEGFSLQLSRRYAHSLPYLRTLAARHGFIEKAVVPVTVRLAEGKGIPGYNVVLELGAN